MGCLGCVGIVLALVLLSLVSLALGRGGRDAPDEVSAWTACQQAVEARLLAPSAARWPEATEIPRSVQPLGDQRFLVASWVESQNAFGVRVRTPYRCLVRFLGPDRFQIERLEGL